MLRVTLWTLRTDREIFQLKYYFRSLPLNDLCKNLVPDIKNPFDYKSSIYALVRPIEWAIFQRKSEYTLISGYVHTHTHTQYF